LGRVLALDYGSARCGCALSDPTGALATPIGVVENPDTETGMAELTRLVADREAELVVVGLPVSLSGEEGPQALETRAFAERLAERLQVPVETYDERFTTKLAAAGHGRAPEDARAAAALLESYLRSRESGARPA
jgi:putative holliday junction resolvase